jgi:hypothetical protein
VTMTIFLRSIAHASKSRTIETIVETSSQNVFNAQLVQKQTTTQFDSKDLAKEIAKYVFFVRNIWTTLYWQKLTAKRKKKEKKEKIFWNYN